MLTVLINEVDYTNRVQFGSLRKRESINQLVETCYITIQKYGDLDYTPAEADRIEILDDDDNLIFAGGLGKVEKTSEAGLILTYDLTFLGDAYLLESRQRVVERYENTTGNDIIADLLSKYATDFDGTNVSANFEVVSMTFNRVTLKDALQKLAKFSNHVFYVGYEKDLHFMPKYAEPAPIAIGTETDNYIFESLQSSDDFTQLRNRVFVEGGLYQAPNRTEVFETQQDQKVFIHASKFASLPTVTADSVPVTVGVDFLDEEDDFDAFWNYNEKYVRFKDSTMPATGDIVEITGPPLYPLIYQVQDDQSITRLGGDPIGVREYSIKDQTIKTIEEAEQRAIAELEAYASKIIDGQFMTNTPGLRSGQIVTINCPEKEISGQYIIQQVDFSMVSDDLYQYKVRYANLNTVRILDILIEQLRERQRYVDDRDDKGILRAYFINEIINLTEVVGRDEETDEDDFLDITEEITLIDEGDLVWVYAKYVPTSLMDPKFSAVIGLAKYQ